jgi:hypothetical protein
MRTEKRLIAKLKEDAHNLIREAVSLREESYSLEEEANCLLDEAKQIEEHLRGRDSIALCVIAKDILKASDEKLGGFALRTLYDVLDGKRLEQEQKERFSLLAREYLHVVV